MQSIKRKPTFENAGIPTFTFNILHLTFYIDKMGSTPKYNWYKIADSPSGLSFSQNGLTEIDVNGKIICLGLHNDTLYACTHKCPHAGGTLSEGYLDASGNIVCPLHCYKFSMQNGRNISGEGYYLKTFPVEIRNDGVFVGIADSSLFGWLK